MKLYKICGGLAVMSYIIGTASVCGAIEWRTSLRVPIGILLFGCVCMYVALKESGGRYDF
ncbi:MAG: hypothetical protein KH452_06075 [Clostridiales bacterium]|nr:hypothetical protein [Clostridiales bacterium]